MNRLKAIGVIAALAAVSAIAVACGNGEAATSPVAGTTGQSAGGNTTGQSNVVGVAPTGTGAEMSSALLQSGGQQAGIWVTGEGTVSLTPDLALLNVGVEATADTVAEARGQAATAMDAIVRTLQALGVEDADIQTRFFNISPMYEFIEVIQGGIRTHKQELVGFQVSNSAAIKIRDLDAVGNVIDDVAAAGGDATRINGISFTVDDTKPFMADLREAAVDDTKPFMADLREAAVADATAKAQHFASLTGVTLGRLVFISESGGGVPVVRDFAEEAFISRAAAAPSPISVGQLDLRLAVQAVFDFQ